MPARVFTLVAMPILIRFAVLILLCCALPAQGQESAYPPCSETDIRHYTARRTAGAIAVDTWRIDFSRFNQYKEAPPAADSGGWAWSTHRIWNSHIPVCASPSSTFLPR